LVYAAPLGGYEAGTDFHNDELGLG